MQKWKKTIMAVVGILSLSLVLSGAGLVQAAGADPAHFYKGKTITWIVASRAGGPTDLSARVIGPFLSEATGAKIRIEDMGSLKGINWVYNRGTKDGLTLLCKSTSAMLENDLLKAPGVRYKAEKYLYISDINPAANVLFVSARSKFKTLDDLIRAKRQLKAGATSVKGALATNAAVTFEILGLDGRVITGYKGLSGVEKGMLNEEVDLMISKGAGTSHLVKSGELRALAAIADVRSGALPDVPTLKELGVKVPMALADAHQTISFGGTSVAMPPGVPLERVEYLRKIFDKISNNKELQENIKKLAGSFPGFIPGKKLQNFISRIKANRELGKQLEAILAKHTAIK